MLIWSARVILWKRRQKRTRCYRMVYKLVECKKQVLKADLDHGRAEGDGRLDGPIAYATPAIIQTANGRVSTTKESVVGLIWPMFICAGLDQILLRRRRGLTIRTETYARAARPSTAASRAPPSWT